ncbi:MAG: efflux RND transporter periplasmic adaptor subunit [Nitrospirae bacterium]|nr:efflux RND transporter periplasmic adaptor subunit [Nitrospirota bacterium]
MRKNIVILIAGAFLAAGLSFFLTKSNLLKNVYKNTDTASHQSNTTQANDNTSSSEAPLVEISADKQQLIGVRTYVANMQPMGKTIRSVGKIEYDERKLSTVNSKLEGWIESLHVDYTGRLVKKGEPLAEIYSPELMATQQEYLNVLKWTSQKRDEGIAKMLAKDADAILEAARNRLKLKDISDEQIKNIETTGKPIRTFTVYSPSSGYVVQKNALRGMKITAGEKLFDVADISTLWIVADIYEYELPMIRIGQTAQISINSLPGKIFSSKIDYVYPSLSGDTRTAKVRFTIPNISEALKPQMFTNIEIKIEMGKRLLVPDDAVIDTGVRQIIYVDKGDGYFEPREVTIGLKSDGMTEITRGLTSGEKVASSANFLIDSEAQLKGVKPLGSHKH